LAFLYVRVLVTARRAFVAQRAELEDPISNDLVSNTMHGQISYPAPQMSNEEE
jgi:hypothetical protein